MEITFVTSNPGKVREFRQILGNGVKLNHTEMEYRELRSDDPQEIAAEAAAFVAEKIKKAVVVEDSGLFISALKDFPGTCSKYVHQRIGLQGILRLMEGANDRKCFYRSAVGYCEPGKKPLVFLGEEEGTVASEIRGSHGFGHDPIFIPKGGARTYGEMEDAEKLKKFRRRAVEKLLKYLKSHSDKK